MPPFALSSGRLIVSKNPLRFWRCLIPTKVADTDRTSTRQPPSASLGCQPTYLKCMRPARAGEPLCPRKHKIAYGRCSCSSILMYFVLAAHRLCLISGRPQTDLPATNLGLMTVAPLVGGYWRSCSGFRYSVSAPTGGTNYICLSQNAIRVRLYS